MMLVASSQIIVAWLMELRPAQQNTTLELVMFTLALHGITTDGEQQIVLELYVSAPTRTACRASHVSMAKHLTTVVLNTDTSDGLGLVFK